jgi:hypothetical protein
MRLYVSSRSYPELREVEAGVLGRAGIWLRAFGSAVRDPMFLGFVALQLTLVLGGLALAGLECRVGEEAGQPVGGGVGLGIVIVKKLVEAHGGQVTVSSTPGEGSSFTFQMPMASVENFPMGLPSGSLERPGELLKTR